MRTLERYMRTWPGAVHVRGPFWLRVVAVLVSLAVFLLGGTATATLSSASSSAGSNAAATGDVFAAGSVTNGSFTAGGGLYFVEEDVVLSNTITLSALTITVTVDATNGEVKAGQFSQPVELAKSFSVDGNQIVYVYTLAPGQRLRAGATLTLAAQVKGTGEYHLFGNDSFAVSAVSVLGSVTSLSGGFPFPAGAPPLSSTPPVAVAGSVDPASNAFYGQDDVLVSNTVRLSALTITITVGEANGPLYDGQLSTFCPAFTMGHGDDGQHLVYVFTLEAGATLTNNCAGMAIAQFKLPGAAAHAYGGDAYAVSYTTGTGVSGNISGTFPAGLPPLAPPTATGTSTPVPPPAPSTGTPSPATNTDTPIPPPATTDTVTAPPTDTPGPSPTSTIPPAATSSAVRGVLPPDQNAGSRSMPAPPAGGLLVPPPSSGTPTHAHSRPTRPTLAPMGQACTTPFLVLTALFTHSTRIFAAGPVDLVRGHTGAAATHRVQTTVVFDNGQGIRLTTGPLVATLACDHLAPAPLHGRARAGSARRDRRQVSLRGAAFTLTIQPESVRQRGHAGATYSLRVQIPRIHYDRTFTRLYGTVTSVKPAATPSHQLAGKPKPR